MSVGEWIETVGIGIDVAGVAVMVIGIIVSAVRAITSAVPGARYKVLRQDIGRSILLGLELLVAADIVRTVAVRPTLESLAILAGIVLIRTFLSIMLEVELEGRLPWRAAKTKGDMDAPDRPGHEQHRRGSGDARVDERRRSSSRDSPNP